MIMLEKNALTFTSGGGNPPIFTKRELQCIQQLIQYACVPQIAKNLNISEKTVDFYLSNISKKAKFAIKNPIKS